MASTLSTILGDIQDRLETVTSLTVLTDVRQVDKAKVPVAVISLTSQTPEGNDKNWKYSTKYKVTLDVAIELVHTSLENLLSLIESVESALNISQKLSNTIEWDYIGWTKVEPMFGSTTYRRTNISCGCLC